MLHMPCTFSKQLVFVLIYWYDVQTVQKYWILALEYRYLPTENEGCMVLQMFSLSMESAFYVPERSIYTTGFFLLLLTSVNIYMCQKTIPEQ